MTPDDRRRVLPRPPGPRSLVSAFEPRYTLGAASSVSAAASRSFSRRRFASRRARLSARFSSFDLPGEVWVFEGRFLAMSCTVPCVCEEIC